MPEKTEQRYVSCSATLDCSQQSEKTCRVPRSWESVSEVKNTYDTYKYLEYICKCQMLWNNLLWTDESKMDLLATVRTDVF